MKYQPFCETCEFKKIQFARRENWYCMFNDFGY